MISSISRDSFDETIRRSKTSKKCCGDRKKSGTAKTMVGQKSGTALAGPAAPATTALIIGRIGNDTPANWVGGFRAISAHIGHCHNCKSKCGIRKTPCKCLGAKWNQTMLLGK